MGVCGVLLSLLEGTAKSEIDEEEPLARNVSPFTVEPGKFTYRLVRAELPFEEYSTVYAHCRVGHGPLTIVPFTLLPPAE